MLSAGASVASVTLTGVEAGEIKTGDNESIVVVTSQHQLHLQLSGNTLYQLLLRLLNLKLANLELLQSSIRRCTFSHFVLFFHLSLALKWKKSSQLQTMRLSLVLRMQLVQLSEFTEAVLRQHDDGSSISVIARVAC